ANNIPAVTRFAVAARDMGDRWPASQAPWEHCDAHHIRERRNGGTHDPDNLICTSRGAHVGIHAHDWDVTLDGATGVATFTRGDRKFQSLPRGRTHRTPRDQRADSGSGGGNGRAPSGDRALPHDHTGTRTPADGRAPPHDRPPDSTRGGDTSTDG